MEPLKKEDHYVQTFMGTTYDLGRPQTIGQLKSVLERIAADLPLDTDLKISEINLRGDQIAYSLVDGIVQ